MAHSQCRRMKLKCICCFHILTITSRVLSLYSVKHTEEDESESESRQMDERKWKRMCAAVAIKYSISLQLHGDGSMDTATAAVPPS